MLQVSLARDADEEDDGDQNVVAPFYPLKKLANWWLVVGDPASRQLLVIKRVTVTKSLAVKLEFTLLKGNHSLKLYVICDSYVLTTILVSNPLRSLKERIVIVTRIWRVMRMSRLHGFGNLMICVYVSFL